MTSRFGGTSDQSRNPLVDDLPIGAARLELPDEAIDDEVVDVDSGEYRQLGRDQEAEALEAELLRMLAYADADHPIVRQIRESQDSRPHLSDAAPVTN